MKRLLFVLSLAFAIAPAVQAFDLGLGLFKKKPKQESTARAKALATTLQSDTDEGKRRSAAEELRSFDHRNAPEALTSLMAAIQRDPVPSVRSTAAESIGLMKPPSQQAGILLEGLAQSDPDASVRESIKSALWQYHLNGYKPSSGRPALSESQEPPVASTKINPTPTKKGTDSGFRPILNTIETKRAVVRETSEPPLAKPRTIEEPEPLKIETPRTRPPVTANSTSRSIVRETPTLPASRNSLPTVVVPPVPSNIPDLSRPVDPLPAVPTVPVPPPAGTKAKF